MPTLDESSWYHFGCFFILPGGVVKGFYATLSAPPAEYSVFFERILVRAHELGAIAVWCEPTPDMRPRA